MASGFRASVLASGFRVSVGSSDVSSTSDGGSQQLKHRVRLAEGGQRKGARELAKVAKAKRSGRPLRGIPKSARAELAIASSARARRSRRAGAVAMDAAPLALLGLAVGTRGVLMPVARCPPHGGRRFVCTMCEEPPAAKLPPPPLESEASQRGVVEVPPGATRVPEAEAARHPAEPDRAISIVAELRSNAALFAAFAFGALSLPNTLVISESRVTSTTSSLST